MPLYRFGSEESVSKIKPSSFPLEKELKKVFEDNLLQLLGVRFIASEFTTGGNQRGRIDTLGLDEDGFPTIIEYKRTKNDNVINQGLFYLDWLVDHKGDFTLAAQDALGSDVEIDWANPLLILIAETFSEYDKYAVNRIGANVQLWTYRVYGENLLYLDPIYMAQPSQTKQKSPESGSKGVEEVKPTYTIDGHLAGKPETVKSLFKRLQDAIFALGDKEEITEKPSKTYVSYKHGKNFCEVKIQQQGLKLWLDINPDDLNDPLGISKDVREIGHHGTGDVEVRLDEGKDFEAVLSLIEQSYQQTV